MHNAELILERWCHKTPHILVTTVAMDKPQTAITMPDNLNVVALQNAHPIFQFSARVHANASHVYFVQRTGLKPPKASNETHFRNQTEKPSIDLEM